MHTNSGYCNFRRDASFSRQICHNRDRRQNSTGNPYLHWTGFLCDISNRTLRFSPRVGGVLATARVWCRLSWGLCEAETPITETLVKHPSVHLKKLSVFCRTRSSQASSPNVFGDCTKVLFQQLIHPLQCLCSFTFSLSDTHTHTPKHILQMYIFVKTLYVPKALALTLITHAAVSQSFKLETRVTPFTKAIG